MLIKIIQMERTLPDGVVTLAHWTASETSEDGFHGYTYGSVSLDPPGEDVIPYEDLTEDQVRDWVTSKMDLVGIQAILDNQIESQRNPVSASGVPWNVLP